MMGPCLACLSALPCLALLVLRKVGACVRPMSDASACLLRLRLLVFVSWLFGRGRCGSPRGLKIDTSTQRGA